MRISRSTSYALLAVAYLARHQKEGIILSQDISKEYNIPLEYLREACRCHLDGIPAPSLIKLQQLPKTA